MILKYLISIKLLLFFTLFMCLSCNESKNEDDKKIEVLTKKSHNGMVTREYLETIKYGKQAEILALKTGDLGKLPPIYLEISHGLSGLELQKESFSYLSKITKQDFDKQNEIFKARYYEIYAYNYKQLGLDTRFLEYNRKSINHLIKAGASGNKLLSRRYGDIGYYYYSVENADSSFYYYNKQEAILKTLSKKKIEGIVNGFAALNNIKGYLFLQYKKQKDSALFYFQKGYDIKKKYKSNDLSREYLGFGDYYFLENDYQKALEYYHKAEENVKVQHSKFNYDNDINRVLADTYKELKNSEKQSFYLEKYTKHNDSIKLLHQKNIDEGVSIILKQKTEESSSTKKYFIFVLLIISVCLLIIGVFIYRYFRKRKKLITEKENIIQEKEFENQDLKQKVNESFEEVVRLAKNNNPEFFTRFQEVYPEVIYKLQERDSKLNNTDLTLCAYYFLGFKSKDVALYTFKSLSTIRNRRQSIRNKLNISADEDMELWIKNLAN